MKEKALKRIHRMGKVGTFFTVLAKIVTIFGLVLSLVLAVALSVVPADLVTINTSGNVEAVVNVDSVKRLSSSTDAKDIERALNRIAKNGRFSVNGTNFTEMNVSKDVKEVSIKADKISAPVINLASIRNIFCVGAGYLVFVLITLSAIGKLCRAVRECETPFEEEVIKRLRRFCYSLWPWVIVDSAMKSITSFLLGNTESIALSINMGMLAVTLTVGGIVYIFKYGAMLQQESDETL